MKSDTGSPSLAYRKSTLKNGSRSINWYSKAEPVRDGSLRKLFTDLLKGAIGRVPRGYKTIRVPEIPLSREDIVVHPAARDPFAYFQRHVGNRHVARGLPQIVPPMLEFVCEGDGGIDESKYMDNRLLVGGFHQEALLSDTCKLKCRVVDHEFACDADIEKYAWQQVLLCDPFKRSDSKTLAAKLNALIQSLPEWLVERLLGRDAESARGTQLTTESLCRALGLRSDSIRLHMPEIRDGGLKTHTYTKHILKKDAENE